MALDYARRARAHAQVGRAWAVPGRLAVENDAARRARAVLVPARFFTSYTPEQLAVYASRQHNAEYRARQGG